MLFNKNLILLFILFCLTSCENFYTSDIVNNSKNEITVLIKKDQEAIAKKRKEYSERGFLVSDKIEQDTVVKIKASETYEFKGQLHYRPDFYDIKEIEIYSGDTLILKCRKDQMQKIFSHESSPGAFDLVIN